MCVCSVFSIHSIVPYRKVHNSYQNTPHHLTLWTSSHPCILSVAFYSTLLIKKIIQYLRWQCNLSKYNWIIIYHTATKDRTIPSEKFNLMSLLLSSNLLRLYLLMHIEKYVILSLRQKKNNEWLWFNLFCSTMPMMNQISYLQADTVSGVSERI